MITVFTPSFADDANTNAQNLTVKEVVARMDPARFRVIMLGESVPDPRLAARPNTQILRWHKHWNAARILFHLVTRPPDVYFFPREGPVDAVFVSLRKTLALRTALVTYVVSGNLENDNRPLLFRQIKECDVVAANSRHMTRATEKLGGREVQTVYDGIDRRYYFPPPSDRVRLQRVLFAGSFRNYKRSDLVVRQAANFPQWEFRLAGSGAEESGCRQLARDLGCNNVRFLGHLPAAHLGEEMRQAQIFFFPSEIEGHPQVLGQAAACALPCIARNTYAPDYVVDGVTGMLGENDDQLDEALTQLIADPDLRSRMSVAAVQHAARFDWYEVTKQWQEIFEDSIMRHRNRRRRAS
jgi:glycosyltransferase involved in cell wall biosynthesis